jgi:hypothetical protein
MLYDLLLVTIHGSVLGPILCAIFVCSLFDLEMLLAFADYILIPSDGVSNNEIIRDMERSLKAIKKWFQQSGLRVNEQKTEACLFFK